MATAFQNPDGSLAIVVFNLSEEDITYQLTNACDSHLLTIKGQALQTVIFK
jgi:hypothetical protein